MPRPPSVPGNAVPDAHHDPLVPYGWDDRVAADYARFDAPDRIPARVIRVERGGCLVASAHGTHLCRPARRVPDPGAEAGSPATGDWVAISHEPGYGYVIAAIVPRRSQISRIDPSETGHQVLAANVDVVFVVHGLDRPLRPGYIERSLIVAWESGAVPVIVLSKADLADGGGDRIDLDAEIEAVGAVAPGVEILPLSSTTGYGIEAARDRAVGHTVAVLGESGVGKSTLVNRLLGRDQLPTASTRMTDGKGRHTTTSRDLVALPAGGVLIDTPGLRTLGLPPGPDGFAETFADVAGFAEACRFRDCRHNTEPGCAVQAAIEDGELEARRLVSYRRLEREQAHELRRADVRARRALDRETGRRYRKARAEWEKRQGGAERPGHR